VLTVRQLEPGLNPARSAIDVMVANFSARFNSQRISATACARFDAIVIKMVLRSALMGIGQKVHRSPHGVSL